VLPIRPTKALEKKPAFSPSLNLGRAFIVDAEVLDHLARIRVPNNGSGRTSPRMSAPSRPLHVFPIPGLAVLGLKALLVAKLGEYASSADSKITSPPRPAIPSRRPPERE